MEEQRKKKYGPSTVATLKVVRESELGAFLDAETGNTNDDILLHKNQQTHPVSIGDEVEVFLYLDPNRKLTASMRVPKMKEGQIARLKVINVSRDGAFVDVGAERGIFMPYAGMRGRPQIGEVVWAKLYTDKSGRLAVTMEVEDEMRRASQPAKGVKKGQMVTRCRRLPVQRRTLYCLYRQQGNEPAVPSKSRAGGHGACHLYPR